MFVDSDDEEWAIQTVPRIQNIQWPETAPIQCQALVIQPVHGPFHPSATTSYLGDARMAVASLSPMSQEATPARRLGVYELETTVLLLCDSVTWRHADAHTAVRILSRFSPQYVILADCLEDGYAAVMHTSTSSALELQGSTQMAQGLAAAVLSQCELKQQEAYYLTRQSDIGHSAQDLLGRLASHTRCAALTDLLCSKRVYSATGDSLYL